MDFFGNLFDFLFSFDCAWSCHQHDRLSVSDPDAMAQIHNRILRMEHAVGKLVRSLHTLHILNPFICLDQTFIQSCRISDQSPYIPVFSLDDADLQSSVFELLMQLINFSLRCVLLQGDDHNVSSIAFLICFKVSPTEPEFSILTSA